MVARRLVRRVDGRGAWHYIRVREVPPIVVISVTLACGMALLGIWIGGRMEEGILQRAASKTVLNMDSFIKPIVQGMAERPILSDNARSALTAVLNRMVLGQDVAAIKIWSPQGEIVYSNRSELIGRTYPLFPDLRHAFNGELVAQLDDLDDEENEYERSLGVHLLEIYAPLRESGTNRIIAVAEFYEIRDELWAEVLGIRLQTYAVVGLMAAAMVGLLSRLMSRQKRVALEKRVTELSQLLAHNRELQCRIQNSHHRMAEINELFLRRVSAELHDAPAQLIGFALLRLDALRPLQKTQPSAEPGELEVIRTALADSLDEIRNISAGLAAPEIEDLSLTEALTTAAVRHAERTGTTVHCEVGKLPGTADPSLKMCLYRFAQEGLNNAFRHADGNGQALRAHCEDGLLVVEISDDGPTSGVKQTPTSSGLGLAGLRGRIESLGGLFEFTSQPHLGTRLTARFNLANTEPAYA